MREEPGRSRETESIAVAARIGPPGTVALLRSRGVADPEVDLEPAGPRGDPPATRYSVESEIGRGGMGVVLRVRDHDLSRSVAMKIALVGDGSGGSGPRPSDRFLEEAQITGQLSHPGVPPVHELGVTPAGAPFFTMALVRGETLGSVFRKFRGGDETWPLARALRVFLRICETMAFAHERGVIHRDLKPDNVMVGRHGEVYVMDWGVAAVRGRDDRHDLRPAQVPATIVQTPRAGPHSGDAIVTMDGTVLGTPAYMPPEQALGRIAELDARADVHAIGAMLYELLAGHPPYLGKGARLPALALLACVAMGPPEPLETAAPDAAPELRRIVAKAMARKPEDRYASAQELGRALSEYFDALDAARRAAEIREAAAVAARRQAEGLIGFFLREFDEASAYLADPSVKGRVASHLSQWFAGLDPSSLSAGERKNHAAALLWLHGTTADPAEARTHAERAASLTEPTDDDGDPEFVTLHVTALCRLAESERRLGRTSDAVATLRRALSLKPRVSSPAFSVPEACAARANVHLEMAMCLEAEDPVGAALQRRAAQEELMPAATPAGLTLRAAVSLAIAETGESCDDDAEAAAEPVVHSDMSAVYVDAWNAYDQAASLAPWNPTYPVLRAAVRVRAARWQIDNGQADQAIVTLEQVIAALDRVWAVGEAAALRTFWREVAQQQYAIALEAHGMRAEAAEAFRAARAPGDEPTAIAARRPHGERILVAEGRARRGEWLARAGRPDAARDEFRAALAMISGARHCRTCRRVAAAAHARLGGDATPG